MLLVIDDEFSLTVVVAASSNVPGITHARFFFNFGPLLRALGIAYQ